MNKSPFPGMDPYLEGEMWQEFHDTLAHQIRSQLMPRLQPNYVALLNKYHLIDDSGLGIVGASEKQVIYPDVQVTRIKEAVPAYNVVTVPALELINPLPRQVTIRRLEIRDVAERRLVTVIEILSPANKFGQGFQQYMRKRTKLLQTDTHLLEVDLLRAGWRIPLLGGELPPAPYYVFLSRFTHRPYTEIWPIQLRDRLSSVPVPLLPPDPDVPLILQAAIDACFELVGYQRLLNYAASPPAPALSPEDEAWIKERLKNDVDQAM